MELVISNRRGLAVIPALLAASLTLACGGSKTDTAASSTPQAGTPPAGQTATAQNATPPAADAKNANGQDPAEGDEHLYDPSTAAGAVRGIPAPTNTASIEAVANFFTEVPGVDLSALDTRSKEKFLHRVNSELCTCGCKNDTIARCAVNDPKCPLVKNLVQKVYEEVKSGR
jgi:hypothetical protein